jgi:hypothetical protein
VRLDFVVWSADERNNRHSFSVPSSIGHFMAFFVFRFVRIPSQPSHIIDRGPCVDVYSYNFPDDKLALKLLGEYSTLVDGSSH